MTRPMIVRLFLICACVLGGIGQIVAQDLNLANQYYATGEYEKSAVLYGQIFEKDNRNDYVFNRYVESMLFLEQYEECEKVIKKQIKKNPESSLLYFTYGNLLDKQAKIPEAEAQWMKAIDKMSPDFNAVSRLSYMFTQINKFDLAILSYEKGGKLLGDPTIFATNLAELYRRKGDSAKMIENYLLALESDPARVPTVQASLARYLEPEDFPLLQSQLYARIQKSEDPQFIEVLAWSFVQRKDFKSALRQFKALDQRNNENGFRIMKLAREASTSRDFDAAVAAYDYIIVEKGQLNPNFFPAKQESMNCRRRKVTEGFAYTPLELTTLQKDYESFLQQYGINRQTAALGLELAELEAIYINDLPKAISGLDNLIKLPGLDRDFLAKAKIALGDYYLMSGERWESTLLFSQVDKEFKEEQIGQEARFKNAKLAYFNGDFKWAQAQFNVLKASTSKLISNDALDLSVFIMDNLNLDTTSEAISLYAGAELLVFQNRFEEAVARLDTLRRNFPDHSLQDDIYYLQAQIAERKRDYAGAVELYKKVAENYPEDIRADNALFAIANLYETRLNDPEKAKTLFEKIFMDYSGSVFAVDARKRYRILRGDKVQ